MNEAVKTIQVHAMAACNARCMQCQEKTPAAAGADSMVSAKEIDLSSTYTQILKAQSFHAWTIEQVLGIDKDRAADNPLDAIKIE